jgi:hypothetical protein
MSLSLALSPFLFSLFFLSLPSPLTLSPFAPPAGIDAALGLLKKLGLDADKFRGMFSNSKEWAKEKFIAMMEKYFENAFEMVQNSIEVNTLFLKQVLYIIYFNIQYYQLIALITCQVSADSRERNFLHLHLIK